MQTKTCFICKQDFPATPEFFTRDKTREGGLHPYCKSCRNAQRARQYRENPVSQIKAQQRASVWYYDNPERAKETRKRNYDIHREDRIKYSRQWVERNIERAKETRKIYRDRYYTENREKYRTWVRNRHARKRAAPGAHTQADIDYLYQQQQGKCAYCGCSLETGFHVDHVIPLARGGSNYPDNLALACASCNKSKGDRLLSEWNPIR